MPEALSALVMDDEDLSELEALVAKFNMFRVLKAGQNELRHSNMLVWLFKPTESHGLDEQFLRRWLMEVMHSANQNNDAVPKSRSPVWIDAATISNVEVHREWHNIDIILEFSLSVLGKQTDWVIAIENKVNAKQGKSQLQGYRRRIDEHFQGADERSFVFLTKNEEPPADPAWLTSTYSDVLRALERSVAAQRDTIGREPLFLIEQYMELLREEFLEDTEAVELARAIYKRHAAAIDFIFECKVDPIFELSNRLEDRLRNNEEQLGIAMSKSGKGRVRLIPKAWDTMANAAGRAWGENGHFVVLELDFYPKVVELNIVAGDGPEDWRDKLWERCGEPPLQRSQRTIPRRFLKAYRGKSNIRVNGVADLDLDLESIEDEIFEWVKAHLKSHKFQEAQNVITGFIKELP
ncbi:PDDEXK-like family protein [Cucumibacter marinus]|uniref:PDDEXK-like family protein n=1 Tax=Cucumibacter marinus TaxID=1121252 RepID=UPI000490B35C|nr:PD-(D/E)XK nuclease family protein [Cucumibacter marinus]